MAIKKPGVAKKQAAGAVPVAPSIRFAADQLIRKTRKIVEDVQRAYVGIFSFIRLLDTDSTPSTQIRIANVNGTLSIYGDPEATAQISLFIRKCLWISDGHVLFQANSGVISLGDVDNFDIFLRATRQGANDYLLEAEIDGGYIALENVTGSQAKVNTHAALTGDTHGLGPTADFESEAGAQTKVNNHAVLTNAHGVSEVADAADLTTHAAKTGDTHGLGPTADFESVSGAQTKVNAHAVLTNAHGASEVADVATVSAEIDADIATHAADTSTHGVSEVADAADLTTHEADTSTHGVAEVADAADLTTHAAKTGDTHGIGPTGVFESTSGAQTKVNAHAVLTNAHGAAEVADVATVSAEIDSDIATHAADTSTHGVAEVADAADLTTHAAKTGDTHGLGPTADFESEAGAQTKVNTHAALSNAHGAAIVADDTRVGCKAWNSGNVSIPDSTNTAITLDSEEYDTDTIHSIVTNTSRLTCVTAGLYMVTSTVIFAANATGVRQIMLWKNGNWNESEASHKTPAASGGIATEVTISALVDLAVDEYVEVYAFQNSGAALNVINYLHFPHLAMQRLSA